MLSNGLVDRPRWMLERLLRPHTLRTRFVIAVLVAVLPLLALAAVILARLLREERGTMQRGLLETSRALASAVDREIQISLTATRMLAASDVLSAGDLRRFHEIARQAREAHGGWRSVFLVDRNGQEVMSVLRPFGAPLPSLRDDPDVTRVLATGEPLISGLRVGQVSGQAVIRVVVPVRGAGGVRYALATTLLPAAFEAILAGVDVGPGRIAAVYDRDGVVVARAPDPERWVGARAPADLLARLQGTKGLFSGTSLDGTPITGAYKRAPGSGFIAVVALPSDVVDAVARRSMTLFLAGGGVLLLSGIALAFVLGERLAAPVAALTRAVAALGTDTPLPTLPATRVREFAGVDRALRRAATGLRERWKESERRLAAEKLREAAESHARRLDHLQRVADAALRNVAGPDKLRDLLASVRLALNGEAAALLLVSDDGTGLELRAAEGFAAPAGASARVAIDQGIAGRIAASQGGLVVDNLLPLETHEPTVPVGVRSIVGAPIRAGDRLLGVLQVGATHACAFTPEDLALLRLSAERVAQAIERERLLEAERTARTEAEAGTRMRDQFLAILGHELRNPLAVITNALAALEHAGPGAADAGRLHAMMARQARHAARLIDELLDVARVQSGKITLDRSAIDLREVARRALSAMEGTGRLTAHLLHFAGPSVPVSGDATRLEQMTGNLLDNALKYTPAGGTVWLETAIEGDWAVLRVRDTGRGIAPDLLPRIFEPFVQANGALDRRGGGLGLGLTLVRQLAELHGGTVAAESPGAGQGSTFTVRLPRPAGDEPGAAPPAVEPGPPRRILVVEDNADVRESLVALLRGLGHAVVAAQDGERALELAGPARPDVALIDIGLPGIDGYEVARRLAAGRAEPLVLIALTGYAQPADRERAAATGFHAHLAKPVEPAALVRALGGAPRVAPGSPAPGGDS